MSRRRWSSLVAAVALAGTGLLFGDLAEAVPSQAPVVSPAPPAGVRIAAPQLVVSTKRIEPFVFVDDAGAVSGFSVDLWGELNKRLGGSTRWVVRNDVGSLIDDVATHRSDAAIAGISMTAERERRVDFSHPYFDSGLQILTRKSGEANPLGILWKTVRSREIRFPFAVMFGFAIVVAHLIWLVERNRNPDDFPRSYLRGVWEGFWWSSVNVLTGGDGEKKVSNGLSRLIAFAWMLMGVLLIAYLTGAVASALTVNELTSKIENLADLPGHRVLTTKGSVAARKLDDVGIEYSTVGSLDRSSYERLLRGDLDAIVYDAPTLRFAASRYGRNQLVVVGPLVAPDKYAIALPSGTSELREQINETLLDLSADGTIARLNEKWFGTT